jgi:hypothetical protein
MLVAKQNILHERVVEAAAGGEAVPVFLPRTE